jgi:chaperonin GroEL (HSP60 family)
MNFNSFIKIKIINWSNHDKSTYINGVVMSKDMADKRMKDIIDKPRILLLKDSLDFPQSDLECAFE